MKFDPISYIRWAKEPPEDLEMLDLASSGIAPRSIHELEPPAYAVEIRAPNAYGLTELKEVIGEHHGIEPNQVLITAGSSMANFLLVMTLVEPGNTVLVEDPAYEPLRRLPTLFGCNVAKIERSMEEGWCLSPEALDQAIADTDARLVVLTNPHNPSGVMMPMDTVQALHDVCHQRGVPLLLDEVYAEFHPHDPAALAMASNQSLIRTSSLTKVLGFGPLRIGWAIGNPDLIAKTYALNDYAMAVHGAINELLGLEVWRQRDRFLKAAHQRAAFNLNIVRRFLSTQNHLRWVDPEGGILGFLEVSGVENTDELAEKLVVEHGVRVVPGSFFERPGYVRIGFGTESDKLRSGLTQLARVLNSD